MKKINDNNYKEISPTSLVTAYARTFTDIPYEKEIFDCLRSQCADKVTLYKELAPEIEARYKLINKLLNKSNIKQVLEMAAGYTSRGLNYSKQGYNYIELDLEDICNNKRKILNTIEKNTPDNLKIMSGNVLNKEVFYQCENQLKNEPIVVINEGLLRYLTFDEKEQVAKNVYEILSKYGGIWITSDVTPKTFITSQNQALPNFNKSINEITDRNNLNNRFENIDEVKKFFGKIGFELIEIHPFKEVRDELYSIHNLNIIDDKIEKTLEDAIVVIMKISPNQKTN